MKLTPPARYLTGLKIGLDELQWIQAEQEEAARAWRRATMLTPGLVIARRPDGSLDDNWRLDDDDDDGSLSLRAGATFGPWPQYAALVAEDGALLVLDRDYAEEITLPNDATWHTVTVRQELTLYDEGAIVLTAGSANITGIGTKFTKYAAYTTDGFGRGTRIRIDVADSALGNEGTYELDTVVSDTVATLRAAIPGGSETIARFTVSGEFIGAVPASPDIHYRRRLVLERQTGIVREPAADTIPLYDVKRDDAGAPNVTFIDRRRQRLYRSAVPSGLVDFRTTTLTPVVEFDESGAAGFNTAPVIRSQLVHAAAVNVQSAAVATCREHELIVVLEDNGNLYTYTENRDGVTAGAAAFAGSDPALVRCPPGSGYTHLLVYNNGAVLYAKTTTDDGTTWSGAVLVLDPTAVDAADTCFQPAALLLANNRVLVAVAYNDNSLGDFVVVGVHTDNYGATWDTNAGVGYSMIAIPGVEISRPSLGQAADGTIWCAYCQSGNDVGITYSQDLTGEWTDGPATVASAFFDAYGFWNNSPTLWVSPEGVPLVLFQNYDTGGQTSWLMCGTFGLQDGVAYVASQVKLAKLNAALASYGDLALAVCQEDAGTLALTILDTISATDDLYLLRYTPTTVALSTVSQQHYLAT